MMRILGLLGKVCQIVKRCLNYSDFTGPITTAIVDPVPFIIYNDPVVAGSFLFAESEESIVDSHESIVIGQKESQSKKDNPKIFPGVNDELAKDDSQKLRVDSPRWLV